MKREPKFFKCKHCGNIITLIHESGAPLVCCGEPIAELFANTTEAATEKHLPVVTVEGSTVTVAVGSVDHPMLEEHYIQWVYLETDKGLQVKYLEPGEKPTAVFELKDEKPVAAYEYCNLHGLWKTSI
ncbi:superoxide reductase [Anaerocolumna cellulosilytica]|uniref:Desulfoferrodoxin n=1 Tax=Anaerocolumna cellulosilytica TaxID=433286 RepID=A0A6S6QY09_9FIRM|nr:desulfoferrodoxin family protein [Anaerocolumna cellulosilytica]MBB5195069.1 superoxide reductase [Anaerocolumna cellulosilytica]BCJ96093.1 superoxide reductase [Anaerocolumna cellulosilytica]